MSETRKGVESSSSSSSIAEDIKWRLSGDSSTDSISALPGAQDTVNYADHPLLRYIQDSVVGHDLVVEGPYGERKVVYCDYTASGRSLSFIEDYIRTYVCPYYGNTHTTTSVTSRQTTHFRDDARDIIKKCVNASKDDVVIFTGSGTTSGIHKVIWGLNMARKAVAFDTVVLIGPYEHHSNILPWKETGATIVRINQTVHGQVDLEHLEAELQKWTGTKTRIIASFSAASNVTGILTDTDAVSQLVHRYDALCIWDYASAGAYTKIDMNTSPTAYKDAVVLSPHKFVGGPGTPGLLIAKRWIFRNPIPDHCGGGTVLFVTRDTHLYLKDIETREEGGTPAIIESIRAGLVFKVKEAVGSSLIEAREEDLCRRAFATWKENSNMIILGSRSARRLPIFSFLIRHQDSGRLLHHNFVSSVLSDLYGIQARGGCACAGPYAEELLGISESLAQKFVWFLEDQTKLDKGEVIPVSSLEIMKPGFTRINLPYFYDDETIDYILQAVLSVADFGWKVLPYYNYDAHTGAWTHRNFTAKHGTTFFSLHDLQFNKEEMVNTNTRPPSGHLADNYDNLLGRSDRVLDTVYEDIEKESDYYEEDESLNKLIPEDLRHLRWFLTPREAARYLSDDVANDLISVKRGSYKKARLPFHLRRHLSSQTSLDY